MKIKLSLISLLIFLGINLFAQEYIIRVKKHGSTKFFYINEKGQPLSDKKYYSATDFIEEGIGIVSLDASTGFLIINSKDEVIKTDVPLRPYLNEITQEPFGYRAGMVRTIFAEKTGALNIKGKLSVSAIYTRLSDFDGNYAIGSIGKKHYIVKNNGDQIELKTEKIKSFKHFSEGLAPIKIGKVWGYIDTLGQMPINAQFKSVGYFYAGLAWAKTHNNKVGYIDKSGKWVIKPILTTAMNFDEESGLAKVKRYLSWGYVNKKGEFKTFGIKKFFHNFHEGLAIKRSKGKVGYINNSGEWVLKPVFTSAYRIQNGFAGVKIEGRMGLIDKEGKWLIGPNYKFVGNAVKIKN